MKMPVLAIAIDGDLWELYIVFARCSKPQAEKDYQLNFMGPYNMGSTYSHEDALRILAVLSSLAHWGLTVCRQWFEADIRAKQKPTT